VAADATAARIMSHDPNRIAQLGMAYDLGLGEMRKDHIEIIGPPLSELRVNWDPARVGGQALLASAGLRPRPCPGRPFSV